MWFVVVCLFHCVCVFVVGGGGGCFVVCLFLYISKPLSAARNSVIAELATDSAEVELRAEHCSLSSSARQGLVTATKLRGQSVRPVQWLPAAIHVQCLHVRSSSDSVLRTLLMTDRCLTLYY